MGHKTSGLDLTTRSGRGSRAGTSWSGTDSRRMGCCRRGRAARSRCESIHPDPVPAKCGGLSYFFEDGRASGVCTDRYQLHELGAAPSSSTASWPLPCRSCPRAGGASEHRLGRDGGAPATGRHRAWIEKLPGQAANVWRRLLAPPPEGRAARPRWKSSHAASIPATRILDRIRNRHDYHPQTKTSWPKKGSASPRNPMIAPRQWSRW